MPSSLTVIYIAHRFLSSQSQDFCDTKNNHVYNIFFTQEPSGTIHFIRQLTQGPTFLESDQSRAMHVYTVIFGLAATLAYIRTLHKCVKKTTTLEQIYL